MKRAKLLSAQSVLRAEGFEVPIDVIERMLDTVAALPKILYEYGDFVIFNEGMGEAGHGTIQKRNGEGYIVASYDYGGRAASLPRRIHAHDIHTITTHREADDYFDIRSGLFRAKLYLSKAQ